MVIISSAELRNNMKKYLDITVLQHTFNNDNRLFVSIESNFPHAGIKKNAEFVSLILIQEGDIILY